MELLFKKPPQINGRASLNKYNANRGLKMLNKINWLFNLLKPTRENG